MIQIDFDDISYLLKGNSKQRAAYKALTENLIFEQLLEFDPILVGSLPIDIELDGSILEIACCFSDHDRFVRGVSYCFENCENFQIGDVLDKDGILLTFKADDFEIEIFAQSIPTKEQAGYKYMMVEYQVLCKHGEVFRRDIIELKKQGLKTEQAFAKLLGLNGDPYDALLKYDTHQSTSK